MKQLQPADSLDTVRYHPNLTLCRKNEIKLLPHSLALSSLFDEVWTATLLRYSSTTVCGVS